MKHLGLPENVLCKTGFSLSEKELDYLNICPYCKTNKHLRVFHYFGAAIFCSKCGIVSAWIDGNEFHKEQNDAMDKWNEQTQVYLNDKNCTIQFIYNERP